MSDEFKSIKFTNYENNIAWKNRSKSGTLRDEGLRLEGCPVLAHVPHFKHAVAKVAPSLPDLCLCACSAGELKFARQNGSYASVIFSGTRCQIDR